MTNRHNWMTIRHNWICTVNSIFDMKTASYIGGIVSSDSIVKQIKATSPLQVSSPPKYIKVFICLRSPWALFIMPVIEFLCEKVLWKPLISWVFSRLSWHLTNFVITQIVQGGSHGQLQLNETQLLGSAFLNKSCLLCRVRCTIMTQNEDTSVKKKKLFLSQCCLISLDIAKNWLYLFSNFELSRKREFSHF